MHLALLGALEQTAAQAPSATFKDKEMVHLFENVDMQAIMELGFHAQLLPCFDGAQFTRERCCEAPGGGCFEDELSRSVYTAEECCATGFAALRKRSERSKSTTSR